MVVADTISKLKFNVVHPDNTTPAEGLEINIYEGGNYIGFETTDSAGEIEYDYGIQEGIEYTLELIPRRSPDLEDGGLYRNKLIKFTPFKTDSEYDGGGDEYVVSQYRLTVFARYIKVIVDDGVSPISGYIVNAYRDTNPDFFVYTSTNSIGEAYIGLELGDNDPMDISAWDMSGYYDSYYNVVSASAGSTSTVVTVSLGQTDAYISASLYDQYGNPYFATDDDTISVKCEDRYSTTQYTGIIEEGYDYVYLNVVASDYDCTYTINGLAGYPYFISVPASGTGAISETVPDLNSQITANLKDSNGAVYYLQPNEYAALECYSSYEDTTYTKVFVSGTSSATLDVGEGSFECHVKYKNTRGFDQYIYVYGSSTESFDFTVVPTDATIRGALVNSSNAAYSLQAGETAHLTCDDVNYTRHYEKVIHPGYSSTSMEVAAGSYYCFVTYDGMGGYLEYITVAANSTSTVSYTVVNRSANIVATLRNSSGTATPLQSGEYAAINCYNTVSGEPSYKEFKPNFSSATLRVAPGTYDCMISQGASIGADQRITIAASQTKTLNYYQPVRDTSVTIRAVDTTTGQRVSGVSIEYNVSSISPSGQSDYRFSTNSTGEATFSLIGNLDYTASLYILGDEGAGSAADFARDGFITADGIDYGVKRNFVEFTASESGSQTIEIELVPLTTFLNISAKDKNGNPVTAGWVSVEHYSFNKEAETAPSPSPSASAAPTPASPIVGAENGPIEDLYYGADIVNGSARVSVIGDKKYEVRVFPYTSDTGEEFPPAPQTVTPATGETVSLNFSVVPPNYTLTVLPVIAEGDGAGVLSTQEVYCYANNANDQFAHGYGTESVALKLLVAKPKKPEKWNIHCHGIILEDDEYRFYFGETIHRPKRQATSGTLDLTLIDEGAFYEEESKTFNSTTDAEIRIAGGVELGIPKGALPQSSTALIKSGTAKGYRSPTNAKVVQAMDISFIVNGENVEELDSGASICFPVDEDDIQSKYGTDADSIYIASYNEETGTWSKEEVDTTVRRADDGTVSVCTSSIRHFSIWGSIVDYIKEARESLCTSFKSRKVRDRKKKSSRQKKKRVRFTWDAPESATDITKYEVDLLKSRKKVNRRKCKKKSDEAWEKAKTYEVVGPKLTRKVRSGKYCWRARVKDGQDNDSLPLKIK